ncbi:hypothetical protein FACS1894201_02910 [Bacteroidia bacterium]|nr:hypothetical protein FACS1894201_02910 [Bacteroidia bacterium]
MVAQGDVSPKRSVVQISGLLIHNDNLEPLPFVHIQVDGTRRGAMADSKGFFSLVTYAGDELLITAIGFHSVRVHIPDTLTSDRYTLIQSMMQDTIELPVTVIYPWPSKEKFRDAFLNLKAPDDDYETARKNLTLAEFRERAKYGKMDAAMNYRNFINNKTDELYYGGKLSGQSPPNNLLNPFAWSQFLRIWNAQKEQKKQKKALEWDAYDVED